MTVDPATDAWLAARPAPVPPVDGDRLAGLSPGRAVEVAAVHGHPVLVHPSGRVFAVDLGDGVAVLQLDGLVVGWRVLDPGVVAPDDLRTAVRDAFRQASRMAR